MLTAVTSYELSLFIHITAVVVGFGATFAESVMYPVALKMSPRNLPYVHRLQLVLNQYFATPALVIVTATGIYQVTEQPGFGFGDFWISASLTIIVVIAVLNLFYFIPSDRRLLPMIEAEIESAGAGEFEPSQAYQRKVRPQGIFGPLTGLLLVAAIFLMVTKPGL